MKFPNELELKSFLCECEVELLQEKHQKQVLYPREHIEKWDSKKILEINKGLFEKIKNTANVYAIFTASNPHNNFSLRYIGQSKAKLAKARLTNHLIKKHKNTGAKLGEIIKHVKTGGIVKVSWINIHPESLRHYIEEELIGKHPEADWNFHGKNKAWKKKGTTPLKW